MTMWWIVIVIRSVSKIVEKMIDLSKYNKENYIQEGRISLTIQVVIPWLFVLLFYFLLHNLIFTILFLIVGIFNTYRVLNPRNTFYNKGSKTDIEIQNYYKNYAATDEGIFEYVEDGFIVNLKELNQHIKWTEINAIFSSNIEFYYEPEYLEIHSEHLNFRVRDSIKGWNVFNTKLHETFSDIEANWKVELKEKFFKKVMRLLYEKDGLRQEEAFKKYYKK